MVNSNRIILVVDNQGSKRAQAYHRYLKQDATAAYQLLTEFYEGPVLEHCRTQRIDVVLLESHFPDDRGFALLKRLREQLVDRCPPIILIDENNAHLAKQALKAGAVDYLVREETNADTLHQALQVVCSTVTSPGQRDREQLLAVSSDLETITGNDGYFRWVSPNFERILGWTPAEMTSRPWTEFVHPDDVDASTLEADRIFSGTETLAFENRYRHKDGSYRWLLWRSRLDVARQVLYGTAIDVTKRKRVETALRKSEERFRLTANVVPTIVWITDAEGRLEFLNRQWSDYTGASAQPSTASEIADNFLHPEDAAPTVAAFTAAQQKGTTFRVEHRIRAADGTYRWFLVQAEPYQDPLTGEIIRWFGTSTDIHDRKQTEAALQASEEKYRSLFSYIDEGYFLVEVIFDEHNQPIDLFYWEANPSATRILGQDFTGRRISEIDPTYEPYWFEIFGRVALTGEGQRLERYAEPDQKWFDFYVFKVGDETSRLIAVMFQDITARKRREADAAFLAEIAHECSLLSSADDVMQAVGARVGAYLNVTNCLFAEIDEAQDRAIVEYNWHLNGMPDLTGTYRLSDFVTESFQRAARSRKTIVIRNTQTDPRTDSEGYAARNIHAFITVPFHRGTEWKYLFNVNDAAPRDWSDDDIALIREVTSRVFPRIERARAEQSLRDSEEQFRLLVTASSDITYKMSADWLEMRYLEGKDFLTSSELPDRTWIKRYVLPEDQPYVLAAIENAIATCGIFELEHRVIRQDGSIGWVFSRAIPLINERGEIVEWIGAASDITDRKQAEVQIAADLKDTRLLHSLSTRLITENDPQRLYEEILDAAIALSQADAGSFQCLDPDTNELHLLVTRSFSKEMVHQFNRIAANSRTSCGRALADGQRAFVDFDAPCDVPDESMQMHLDAGLLSAQSTPLLSRSGELIGMFSTHWRKHHRPSDRELRFLDLLARQTADLIEQHHADTERQQLLEREQAARAEAERANRIKDEFLAILSHELRSPLNPILGWSKLLQTRRPDEIRTHQALITIERNAKLLTQLIDDLLDVARILRGKLQINDEPIELASVIEAAIGVVETAANAKSLTIHTDLDQRCLVKGDGARLQQVVWNLLSNAIKFTPDGGRIDVGLTAVHNRAEITVADTGKGIHPDFLPRLFEAFLQEDVSTTRRYGGLGLGLSIVKYLVEAHGGTITAESPGEGLGANFTVHLPLLRFQPLETADDSPASVQPNLAGLRVLAVDDRADARELLEIVLAQYGASPLVVASGPEALEALPDFQPQVLVCDIGMPDMDGYTLMQRIRNLPPDQGGNTPAIAVTAFAKSEDAQRALHYGYQSHLPKPIEPDNLVSVILDLVQ